MSCSTRDSLIEGSQDAQAAYESVRRWSSDDNLIGPAYEHYSRAADRLIQHVQRCPECDAENRSSQMELTVG